MSFAEADLLVLGASMLGIELLYQLRRRSKKPVRTIVVDRQERHPYIPLCHERLCGRIPAHTSAVESAAFVRAEDHARFVQGEITAFDPGSHSATLANGDRLRGRIVVVGLGSAVEPAPAVDGAGTMCSLKSELAWAQANVALEATLHGASAEPEILVVGGGISGVELAGELAHLRRARPAGWAAPVVTLAHAGERLLSGLTPRASERAHRLLAAQGVNVRLGERASASVSGPALTFWAGGLRPPAVVGALGLPTTEAGWLSVGPTLQCFPTPVPTDPEVFAGGDIARIHGGNGEWPTMQRAIECIWQAKTIARNVLELLAQPEGYPNGVPPLHPHRLREDFPHGVSVGARSLIVYGPLVVDPGRLSVWFRRWLMRRYLARYAA